LKLRASGGTLEWSVLWNRRGLERRITRCLPRRTPSFIAMKGVRSGKLGRRSKGKFARFPQVEESLFNKGGGSELSLLKRPTTN